MNVAYLLIDLNTILEIVQKFLEVIGFERRITEFITITLLTAFLIIIVLQQILTGIEHLVKLRHKRIVLKDLHPFYTTKEINDATRYYIETHFQNVPPSQDEEPGRTYISAARELLIPLFLRGALKKDLGDNKYYLILADSGMGKTTFMINFLMAYRFRWRWFWQKNKYQIKLFPLGHPATMDRLRGLESKEKEKTILLLDAFDEDVKALQDYEKRLNEIIDVVWEFRKVIITCRTQFFPSSTDEPTETGRFKFGPQGGEYHFQKLYISVFSKEDIKKYLRKKFGSFLILDSTKYLKALTIVLKSPNLMMRPMLLSHIDDLIGANVNIKHSYQVYGALIDAWLTRESKKPGMKDKYKGKYKKLLSDFSKALARDLYINRDNRDNRFSLMRDEIIDNPKGLQLKDIEGFSIDVQQFLM